MKERTEYDILIVGGGMVGASLVCALAGSGYRIAMLESKPFGQSDQPSYDSRTTALAYASKNMLEALGVWQSLSMNASPIKQIHVSESGRFGAARFSSVDEGVEALGFVATNQAIGQGLYAKLEAQIQEFQDAITVIAPAQLQQLTVAPDHVSVRVELQLQADASQVGILKTMELKCRLLIAADGSASTVRQQAGFKIHRLSYGQSALIANVTPERPHRQIAYEQFSAAGPLALLPMRDDRCSLVWTTTDELADDLLALEDASFLVRLQQRFGYRLGRFVRVGSRQIYPLSLIWAPELVRPRVVLVGNAAHSLHPVAGQGFNLALRDVAALAELLAEAQHANRDIGSEELLQRYAQWRRYDCNRTLWFTDGLIRLFTNPLAGVRYARGLGLAALARVPPLRRWFVRGGMGFVGRLPRLIAGQPLRNVP